MQLCIPYIRTFAILNHWYVCKVHTDSGGCYLKAVFTLRIVVETNTRIANATLSCQAS